VDKRQVYAERGCRVGMGRRSYGGGALEFGRGRGDPVMFGQDLNA